MQSIWDVCKSTPINVCENTLLIATEYAACLYIIISVHMQSIWDVCKSTPSLFEWFYVVGGQLICVKTSCWQPRSTLHSPCGKQYCIYLQVIGKLLKMVNIDLKWHFFQDTRTVNTNDILQVEIYHFIYFFRNFGKRDISWWNQDRNILLQNQDSPS
jgi:hypothetical protein